MKRVLLLLACLWLSAWPSCPSNSVPRSPGDQSPAVPGGLAGLIAHICYWTTGVVTIAILIAVASLWFVPNKRIPLQIIVTGLTILVACQILLWVGDNLKLAAGLVAIALVLGGLVYVWAHRRWIEKRTGKDLNGDGIVG